MFDSARLCGGCGARSYCGRECQKNDWKNGDHKTKCAELKLAYQNYGHEVDTSKGKMYNSFCSMRGTVTLAEMCPSGNERASRIALSSLLLSFESWDKPAPCRIAYRQDGVRYESVIIHPEIGIMSKKKFLRLSKPDLDAAVTLREWVQRQLFLPQSERRAGIPIELSVIILRVMVLKLKNRFGTDPYFDGQIDGHGVFTDL